MSSLDQVLNAAIVLANRDGMDALTIRTLAKHVDMPPMSLYSFFSSKQDLTDQMATRMLGGIKLPPADTDVHWEEVLVANMMAFYEVLENNPALVELLSRQRVSAPSLSGLGDGCLAQMRRGKVPSDQAATAYGVLLSYVLGCVVYMHPRLLRDPQEQEELDNAIESSMRRHAAAEYLPHVATQAPALARLAHRDLIGQGLNWLVKGIAESTGPR